VIRRATEADLAACTDVWLSTQSSPVDGPVTPLPLYGHELRTSRLLVAEGAGEVVGFGATLTRGVVTYLADLFVRPYHQSSGVGRQLLEELLTDNDGRLFTFASDDARAQRLYSAFGMEAVEQYHYLNADVDALSLTESEIELHIADGTAIVPLATELSGRPRDADIDFANSIGSTWRAAQRNGETIGAVAVVAPVWWNPWIQRYARIGPVMAHHAADIEPLLVAAISVAASLDVERVSAFVPASSACLPQLLSIGFEIVDTDLLMSTDPNVFDRARYLPQVDTA
jgi:ribosomal protein S18 acetylase RimI-like enzyme